MLQYDMTGFSIYSNVTMLSMWYSAVSCKLMMMELACMVE